MIGDSQCSTIRERPHLEASVARRGPDHARRNSPHGSTYRAERVRQMTDSFEKVQKAVKDRILAAIRNSGAPAVQ